MTENKPTRDQVVRAMSDPVYYIETFLKTFDPRKKKKDISFTLYDYQADLVRDMADRIRNGQDLFIEKSRDMGVSWTVLALLHWFWSFTEQFQCLIGSRKQDYVDNWQLDSLFGKLDYLNQHSPIKPKGFNPKEHRTYMKLVNPDANSVILGESANPNFARAGRYNVVLFDELAFWQFAQNSWEAAGDSSPCRIAITTPPAQPHFSKALRNSGVVDVKTLHWRLHPEKDEEWYEHEKARRSSEEVAREIDINWEGSLEGIVYQEIDNAVVGNYPFLPSSSLYVSWDFGLDGTAVQWWQRSTQSARWRLVESYYKTDKVIQYFLPLFNKPIDSAHQYSLEDLDIIDSVKQLPKAIHYGDPDVAKRSYQTGETTRQVLASNGIYVQSNTKANDLEARKTAVKLVLQQGIEVNDTPGNRFWLECVKGARYPTRPDTSQSVTANVKPIHDWTSHHRSSTEYMFVNYQEPKAAGIRTFRHTEPTVIHSGYRKKARTFK